MHKLTNLAGCVGTLLADSGLKDILKSASGGVNHMLSGEKFLQNVWSHCMLAEELVCEVLEKNMNEIKRISKMIDLLEKIEIESMTAKVWLDNLIKPVLIMIPFVRSEKESDWYLHLIAVNEMITYFFAAAHIN